MPILLYSKNNKFYISHIPIHTSKFKYIKTFENLEIENISYLTIPKNITFHILNNSLLIPTKYAYYLIIDSKTLEVTTFEKLKVLKNYKIEQDDLVFEIYFINNAIKIFYGIQFEPKDFYNICITCGTIHTYSIETCIECNNTICKSCNIFNSEKCNDCDVNLLLDD